MRIGGSVVSWLLVLSSCAPALTPAAPAPAAPPAVVATGGGAAVQPRLFPPTSGAGVVSAGVASDGARRSLAFGLRVLERADGSLDVGDELLPAARNARFLELPARLGGGYLFWIVTSSGTLLYRGASWTAKLEPLAQLDFEVERLVPGFDRLLILPRHDAEYRALDLETGKPTAALGLPPAPAYGGMAFVDGWFGAVQVPFRGVLLSFDAGQSFHPLGLQVSSFEPLGDGVALSTNSGDYTLDARGTLSRALDRDEAKISRDAAMELSRAVDGPSFRAGGGEPLLRTAVLSGFPDGKGAAYVASGGTLSRVALDSGKVLARRERAYVGAAECQGVRFGNGAGFVCGQGRELTRLYRVTEPLGLAPVLELAGARVVSDSGSGGLVVHGGCGSVVAPLRHCIVRPSVAPFEVASSSERDRVVALADGRIAVFTPPDAKSNGQLVLWRAGVAQRVPLTVTPRDARQKRLLAHGIWLDGMVEQGGVLSGWVVGAGPFAGVELNLNGKLGLRRVQDNAGRALFAGRRALLLGENGLAAETTDGGTDWQAVELPPEIDLKSQHATEQRQGCSALGCSFAGFTRVGYFDGRTGHNLASPLAPPRVSFPGPGGSHWRLHCALSGETSAPALPLRPTRGVSSRRLRLPAVTAGDEQPLPALSPLFEQAPPTLPEGFDGVDAGTEQATVQLRLYAAGPRGGDWSKTGTLSLAFVDRFATKGGVHRTATARSPWADLTTAADALGAEPSTSAAGLAAALDPGGNAGAVVLNSRGTLELFVFETGRVPQHIPNVGRLGLGARLAGFVKTKAGSFLGSYDENARTFRIYRVAGQDLEVALEAIDVPPPRGANAELVRSASGDLLGIWVRSTGWFVHPVDLEAGLVEAPYQVTPLQMANMPSVCTATTEGFLLSGVVAPEPYADAASVQQLRNFEGRFRVSSLGLCVDGLALQGELRAANASKTPEPAAGRPTASSVVATLTERKALGRRAELRCSN